MAILKADSVYVLCGTKDDMQPFIFGIFSSPTKAFKGMKYFQELEDWEGLSWEIKEVPINFHDEEFPIV